jgi:hypothetical protein
MQFTIGQAARETGKSKSTISKALKNGTLSAEKKPDGSYQIDAAELFRVFPRKAEETPENTPDRTNANTTLLIENTELRAKLEMQDQLIRALEGDKLFLQDQLSRTTLLLTSAQVQNGHVSKAPENRPWWQRWFH